MSRRPRTPTLALAAIAILAAAACSKTPPRVHPPGINASAGDDAIEQYDADGNGKIDGEELNKAAGIKGAMQKIDTNGDGAVTADEIYARIEAWEESKVGRTSQSVQVTRNGQPLVGATVKMVPEGFLGDDIQPASGETDQRGVARPKLPAEADPEGLGGMQVGLYRVEITKPGENIPARYNTETELGVEVAQDMAEAESGIQFDLTY
jgi:hypothetical protein